MFLIQLTYGIARLITSVYNAHLSTMDITNMSGHRKKSWMRDLYFFFYSMKHHKLNKGEYFSCS